MLRESNNTLVVYLGINLKQMLGLTVFCHIKRWKEKIKYSFSSQLRSF